jgi:hypothetical protein
MSFSKYERFKWEVLAHLFHRFGMDAPWFEARKLAPDDPAEQAALVRRVVLDMLDDDLIFGAYASRDDGYKLDLDRFGAVSRDIVLAELDRPLDHVEPEDHLFWLLPTEKAEEIWQTLPPDAFLNPESASKGSS